MNRLKYALGAAACAALLSATWLVSSSQAQAPDTPIIVSDGSIVIQSPGVDFSTWAAPDSNHRDHPQTKTMGSVEVTGPNGQNATCSGKNRCTVEMTWSTGQAIRVMAKQNGNRAVRLESVNVSFDDPTWDKSNAQRWSFPLSATPTITIRDGNAAPVTICQGNGCSVTIHYQ